MSKRRFENIFKRKLSLILKKIFLGERLGEMGDMGGLRDLREAREIKERWMRNQFKDFSKLGGELVVMKMGS